MNCRSLFISESTHLYAYLVSHDWLQNSWTFSKLHRNWHLRGSHHIIGGLGIRHIEVDLPRPEKVRFGKLWTLAALDLTYSPGISFLVSLFVLVRISPTHLENLGKVHSQDAWLGLRNERPFAVLADSDIGYFR